MTDVNPVMWLKAWLRRPQRSHRVTTITRTVMRDRGEPEQHVEKREVTEEVEPEDADRISAHVSIAAGSVAAVVLAAFLLGWWARGARS